MGHLPFARWLIKAHRPSSLVELGVFSGASFLTFCHTADELGIGTKCIGVDTWKGDDHAGFYDEEVYKRLSKYVDRHYPRNAKLLRITFDEATDRVANGSVDLLHIDGLHTYEAVRHDFETWRPKMSKQGLVLFHDISVRERGFGVYRLWEELSRSFPSFAFEHAYGLGIIGVGHEFPEAIKQLFLASDKPELTEEIRRHFEGQFDSQSIGPKPVPLSRRLVEYLRRWTFAKGK